MVRVVWGFGAACCGCHGGLIGEEVTVGVPELAGELLTVVDSGGLVVESHYGEDNYESGGLHTEQPASVHPAWQQFYK